MRTDDLTVGESFAFGNRRYNNNRQAIVLAHRPTGYVSHGPDPRWAQPGELHRVSVMESRSTRRQPYTVLLAVAYDDEKAVGGVRWLPVRAMPRELVCPWAEQAAENARRAADADAARIRWEQQQEAQRIRAQQIREEQAAAHAVAEAERLRIVEWFEGHVRPLLDATGVAYEWNPTSRWRQVSISLEELAKFLGADEPMPITQGEAVS